MSQHLTPARSGLARSGATRSGWPVAQGAVLPTYALSGVARSGATRSNYTSSNVFISIGGVSYGMARAAQPGVLAESLQINDALNDTPTTATMTTAGFIPTEGQEVIVTIGSKNNGRREFAGTILSTREYYQTTPRNYQHALNCIDYTWGLNTKKVRAKFTASTVGAIAASVMATYTTGYTLVVDPDIGAAKIDEITFTEQDVTQTLAQLVKRVGGAWMCDYQKRVRLFFSDTEGTAPTLINAVHKSLTHFEQTRDLSQTISRMYVEGGGSNAATDVPVGETILPVTAGEWYETTGGVVVCGPQRINYTGCVLGGKGGLVGPGAAPSGAPTLTLAAGSGVNTGAHSYAITYKTAVGESLASPVGAITVGAIDPPTAAPVPGAPQAGSGPDPGAHDYAVSYVTASGETTPGPRVSYTTGITAAPATPTPSPPLAGAGVDIGPHDYAMTCVTASGETTPSPISATATTYLLSAPSVAPVMAYRNSYGFKMTGWRIGDTLSVVYTFHTSSDYQKASPPSTAATIVLKEASWATPGQGWIEETEALLTSPYDPVVQYASLWVKNLTTGSAYLQSMVANKGSYWTGPNQQFRLTLNGAGWGPAVMPPTPTDVVGQIPVTLPLGDATVTGRKLYRRSGGAGLRLAATIANNTTTSIVDTLPNASLGAAPPTVGTATVSRVLLNNIPIGPHPLIGWRKVYRTAANQTALKLLTTIADNTTTSFLDTLADASLGAAAPTTNTAAANQVQVGISIGASAVTQRLLYRTAADASTLKLLTTIADNSTTGYLDALADASLGAQSPPVSDTSGLTQPGSSQVPPGSTELIVANIGVFESGGGWAIIGNGDQVIRYTGKTASKLTGIPASGPGAIVAAISWNSTVTAAAQITGIPATGNGSIKVAIITGDEVNLWVQVDDLAARSAIAAALGTDGIIEDYIQDRRLSHREALARAQAQLETKNQIRIEIRYTTRDINTRTGKLQRVNLGPPFNIVDTSFLIQSVSERPHNLRNIPVFGMPSFDAVASNSRFTFDEFLRMIHDEVT